MINQIELTNWEANQIKTSLPNKEKNSKVNNYISVKVCSKNI